MPQLPRIAAVSRVSPPHYVDQATLTAALRDHWSQKHHNPDRLDQLHQSVRVRGRHLALPLPEYPALESFSARNAAWLRVATELGERAVQEALTRAGLSPDQVHHLFFVTVTGVATPSVDARLVNRLGLRRDVRRTPLFGLGCVAGAAGLARAADALRGAPEQTAVLVSVELCSLTLQRDDLSIANVIASGLFGDGAAAAVLGPTGAGPRVLGSHAAFYPRTERVMGWDVVDSGLKVVLSAEVPELVRRHLRADVDAFLAAHHLERGQIRHWIAHTGGPKVLEAMEEALQLGPGDLERSWRSLSQVGNLSSASVLFVLGDLLDSGEATRGDLGLLLAMGPGFCAEMVLLQW